MRICILIALLMLLSSCSTLPSDQRQAQREALWQMHLASLRDLVNWRATGRIAASTPDDGGSARLLWRQRGDHFVLRLHAGLGHGTMQLSSDIVGARLVTPSGETLAGRSADELLYQYLGWRVPVWQLRQWLIGRPGSASDYTIDRFGLLESIRFDGWMVEFRKYTDGIYPILPARIALYHDDIEVHVVVDGWSQHNKQDIFSRRIAVPEPADG